MSLNRRRARAHSVPVGCAAARGETPDPAGQGAKATARFSFVHFPVACRDVSWGASSRGQRLREGSAVLRGRPLLTEGVDPGPADLTGSAAVEERCGVDTRAVPFAVLTRRTFVPWWGRPQDRPPRPIRVKTLRIRTSCPFPVAQEHRPGRLAFDVPAPIQRGRRAAGQPPRRGFAVTVVATTRPPPALARATAWGVSR
jgi:hypothetical protein